MVATLLKAYLQIQKQTALGKSETGSGAIFDLVGFYSRQPNALSRFRWALYPKTRVLLYYSGQEYSIFTVIETEWCVYRRQSAWPC
jgi:hypothetical protein